MTNPFFHPAIGRTPIRRNHRVTIGLALTALVAAGATAHRQDEPDHERAAPPSRPVVAARNGVTTDTAQRTWLEMKNVNLRVAKDAVVGIRTLRGQVMPTKPGGSALLDSTSSF